MRYRIIQANEADRLSEQVEGLLNNGWKLHGGLLITPNLYTQVLINEQDSPVGTQTLSSEDVKVLKDALSRLINLNIPEHQAVERASQILSKLSERSAESADGDAEPGKE